MSKVEITRIKIKLESKEVELSSEEARKVYKELGKLFGESCEAFDMLKELKKLQPERYIPMPYPVPQPYIPNSVWISPRLHWQNWEVWCGDNPKSAIDPGFNGSGTLKITC